MSEALPPDPLLARACPGCGLTEEELGRTGRMGCAQCYRTFARQVAQAVRILHGVDAPPEPNPWPTRRAVKSPKIS